MSAELLQLARFRLCILLLSSSVTKSVETKNKSLVETPEVRVPTHIALRMFRSGEVAVPSLFWPLNCMSAFSGYSVAGPSFFLNFS